MKRIAAFMATLCLVSLAWPGIANEAHHPPAGQSADTPVEPPLSEGQVRKIDKENGKLTIKHGPLVNLDMPAMTMVFHVQDPAMLDEVKVGDSVRFRAEQVNGQLTVTRLESSH